MVDNSNEAAVALEGGGGGGASIPAEQPTSNGGLDATGTATSNNNNDDDGNDEYQILIVPTQDEDDDDDDDGTIRQGTISSARFNILSTMVGGGCLSLPLAFQQSGNALVGPIVLIFVGLLTDFCFRLLVTSASHLNPPHFMRPGKDSFESITSVAFGPKAYVMSMGLVTAMCFFGAVGYSVLLRDMMEPINDSIPLPKFVSSSNWLSKNFTMFLVILFVTPATTLQTFTALKNCGAASMTSILVLGSCIVVRSVQCNATSPEPWYTYLTLWPESPRELLNAAPLYISCFVCHYNILPVHNELKDPTPSRVSWWLRSTTWFSVILYLIMGFAGSSYGHCTKTGKVQGNVLLDFDENDPLLMVGRMCLALTITLAFPMLVIPARDILLRSVILPCLASSAAAAATNSNTTTIETTPTTPAATNTIQEQLQEPLLQDEEQPIDDNSTEDVPATSSSSTTGASYMVRLLTAIGIFWTSGIVASCVESIDIVWDLLGSSLSILLSYLIPCGSYLVIMRDEPGHFWSKVLCWMILVTFIPLMFISTGNAINNTFFQ